LKNKELLGKLMFLLVILIFILHFNINTYSLLILNITGTISNVKTWNLLKNSKT